MAGSVVALHQSRAGGQPPLKPAQAMVVEGAGLDGDRHSKPGSRRALLLMEQEVLDRLSLTPGVVSEQITVRGVDLHRLPLGARLRIGAVTLVVNGPCDPCEQMEKIRPGLQQELQGQRGRFVRVVTGGSISVGDPIVVE